MQIIVKNFMHLMSCAIMVLALAACSHSNDNPNYGVTIPGMSTASIAGTVNTGTIVAVDAASNTEVRRVASSKYSAGLNSFSMPLAIGKSYKFYVIENAGSAAERLYPVYQGTANKFSVTTTNFLNFGYISTLTGIAMPSGDITKVSGVASVGEDKSIPASLARAAFTGADLQGNWQVLQLVCGHNPRWIRSLVSMDAAGTTPATDFVSSQGSGTTKAATYSLTPGGVVTVQSGFSTIFNGVMAKDKSMIVGTSSPESGNYALVIMLKAGATFAAADLQGSWKFNQLSAGVNPAWGHGDAAIDANGVISVTKSATSASSVTTAPDSLSGSVSMDAAGIVTATALPAFYGVMSADKELLIAVTTNCDNSPEMMIFTRDNGPVLTGADINGLWRANWLSATGSSSGTAYWGRSFYNVDNGNSYLQSISQSYSDSPDVTLTTEIMENGAVSFKDTDFYGYIAPGKKFMVGTMTNGTSNFSLFTFIK